METIESADPGDMKFLIQEAEDSLITVEEINDLKEKYKQVDWYSRFLSFKSAPTLYEIPKLQMFYNEGILVPPHTTIERELSNISLIIEKALDWELKVRKLFDGTLENKHSVEGIQKLLDSAKKIPCVLPSYATIKHAFTFGFENMTLNIKKEKTDIACSHVEREQTVPEDLSKKRGRPRKESIGKNFGLAKLKKNKPKQKVEEPDQDSEKAGERKEEPVVKTEPREENNSETDDAYEFCSHPNCINPGGNLLFFQFWGFFKVFFNNFLLGSTIDWIQCDNCNKWYHNVCIKLTKVVKKNSKFVCKYCTPVKTPNPPKKRKIDTDKMNQTVP